MHVSQLLPIIVGFFYFAIVSPQRAYIISHSDQVRVYHEHEHSRTVYLKKEETEKRRRIIPCRIASKWLV
jgi:hypothetical protein